MKETIIKVEGLGKKYLLGSAHALSFADLVRFAFNPSPDQAKQEFWALKNLSFEIKAGETVGIIGKNASGKSTLLKILSKITYPTEGRFEIDGRASSLLEVGTGFHPELSGRENIFLNGTILGMRRKEIKSKFDEIVDFSGISKFIDTPVKHYSSGMSVRLAFSVAAHLEAEILIIDEVLAVGDAEFQKKCLGKMDEVTRQGRTILFVSHDMGAVSSLCSKGMLLNKGTIEDEGSTSQIVEKYLNSQKPSESTAFLSNNRKGNGSVVFRGFKVKSSSGDDLNLITWGQAIHLEFEIEVTKAVKKVDVGWSIHDAKGHLIANNYSRFQNELFEDLKIGMNKVGYKIQEVSLNWGVHYVKGHILADQDESDCPDFTLGQFEVKPTDIFGVGKVFALPESKIIINGEWQRK